jgi:DNA-directed RNA polymerase subunit RPC12/RpoP
MSTSTDDSLRLCLTTGIAAAKAGDKHQARLYLERVLRLQPSPEERVQALLYLQEIADDPVERRAYLEQILIFDPANPTARQELAILEGRLTRDQLRAPGASEETGPAPGPEPVPSRRFVCKNCGGIMRFDPWKGRLICQYCGHTILPSEAVQAGYVVVEGDFLTTLPTEAGHRWQRQSYVVQCAGCGSRIILSEGQFSASCPFCGSPQVARIELDPDVIPPHAILPFRVSQEQAVAAVQEWLGSGWFAPADLRRAVRLASIRRAYLPFWAFDFIGTVKWNALVQGGPEWRPTADALSIFEENVLVPASATVPAGLLEQAMDFDLHELEPFAEEKLAGWPAELYQVSLADASIRARERVAHMARRRIAGDFMAGKSYRALSLSTHMVNIDRFQHLLLPFWLLSYRYRDQLRQVVVNGQTGKVAGELPRTYAPLLILAGLALAVIAAFAVLIYLITSSGGLGAL